jgi:hypothetical protein
MVKTLRTYSFLILAACGLLLLTTGCDIATNPALAADASARSTDLTVFIQQFAREAIAALLL